MRQIVEEMITLWPQARITFLAADGTHAEQYATALLEQGIEVVWPSDVDAWLTWRLFHYSMSSSVALKNVVRFDSKLRRTQPQALRVFDVEALFYRRLDRMKEFIDSERDRDALRELLRHDRTWELTAVAEADAAWCVTPEEEDVVSAVAPDTPRFPVAYFCARTRPHSPDFADRRDLVFFGGFLAGAGLTERGRRPIRGRGNDAAPVEARPRAEAPRRGGGPTAAVRSLDSDRVSIVGHVDDPRPSLDRTLVDVAPMRFGSGLKLRFVETIAAGQPLVTVQVWARRD